MNISIIGGAGRVGLPLALVLAENGFDIKIVDLDSEKVDLVNSRIMPFHELGAQEILEVLPEKRITANTGLEFIIGTEVCVVIIGTPVLSDGLPSTDSLLKLVHEMIPFLDSVKLLILRSTVFPGITKKIKSILLENNLQTEVVFCPERLVEGNAIFEIKNLPQIIGADEDQAYKLAFDLFKVISPELLRTTTEEAEIVKLFANSFRYLMFATANEFFEICVNNNINWEQVWHAIRYKYPRASSLPNPGFAAGPCLMKDTQQLNYYNNNNFNLGKAALEINENFPDFLVEKLCKKIDISNKTIGILGMTFKGQIDDFRDSLSFRLKRILELKAEKVICSDSRIKKEYFVDTRILLEQADIIIIAAAHSEYRDIITHKPIIDVWRITENQSLI